MPSGLTNRSALVARSRLFGRLRELDGVGDYRCGRVFGEYFDNAIGLLAETERSSRKRLKPFDSDECLCRSLMGQMHTERVVSSRKGVSGREGTLHLSGARSGRQHVGVSAVRDTMFSVSGRGDTESGTGRAAHMPIGDDDRMNRLLASQAYDTAVLARDKQAAVGGDHAVKDGRLIERNLGQ